MALTDELPIGPGDVISDKYRVEHVIGQGGMGVIVKALHLHLRDHVAIKFLQPAAAEDTTATTRFHREARICARLKSEHVVRILDYGVFENDVPLIVMEYLRGRDLAAVLEKEGNLPLPKVVDYLLQACDAIAEAHNRGLVHRDLKPSNLFLTHRPDGTELVKVLDFGLAKRFDSSDSTDTLTVQTLTAANMIVGSPSYMSPEQVSGLKSIDSRSDVWSLGVILCELLTGKVPFKETTPMQTLAAILRTEPPTIREIRPELPQLVDDLLLWCLKKEPDERCPDVISFARKLAACLPADTDLSEHRFLLEMKSIAPTFVAKEALARAKRPSDDDEPQNANVTWKRTAVGKTPDSKIAATTAASPGNRWIGTVLGIVGGAVLGGSIVVIALKPKEQTSPVPSSAPSAIAQPVVVSAQPTASAPIPSPSDSAASEKPKPIIAAPPPIGAKPAPAKGALEDRE